VLIFELLVLIGASLYIVLNRVINRNFDTVYIIGFLVTILFIHLLVDGYRWQLIPAYMIWIIALITALRQPDQQSSIVVRIAKTLGLSILLVLAIILPSLLPVFELPEPTGPYTVGTTDLFLELDREEMITVDETDRRKLMIKVWYPSNESEGEKDLYIDRAGRNGFAQKYGLPNSMLNYLDKVETNVYRNIPVADDTFPVLIFSHGYHSKANGYYALLSEVVSHGYVVFAINHTYESTGTTFPDGTEVYFEYDHASRIESGSWETLEPAVEAFQSDLSFDERHPIIQNALTTYYLKDMVTYWADDIVDVLSELDDRNNSGIFEGNLDVSNVGVFGHSRGGGAAGESLLMDDRIKAGANLDGVQWGQMVDTRVEKPFLHLSSDWPEEHEDFNQHAYVNRSSSVFYDGRILQSGHSNFMDIPYMIPLQSLNQAGDIDPDLAIEIASRVVTSFFDEHLKSKDIDLFSLKSEYELLEMNVFRGDSMDVNQD
jgi:predicted dienelactone hydrolase